LKSFKQGQEGIREFSAADDIGVDLPREDEMDGTDY